MMVANDIYLRLSLRVRAGECGGGKRHLFAAFAAGAAGGLDLRGYERRQQLRRELRRPVRPRVARPANGLRTP